MKTLRDKLVKKLVYGEGYAPSQLTNKTEAELRDLLVQCMGGWRYEMWLDAQQMEILV